MSKIFEALETVHIRFIEAQHIFFVATGAPDGRVNLSPKGGDALRVQGPNRILWRNITGSGNETAGHLRETPRMTLMWCSFEKRPLILRAYGTARAIHEGDAEWPEMNALFPPHEGARQVFDMSIDMVQTSCGYAVPFIEFTADRDTLDHWTDDKGPDGIRRYWAERNATTIDGKPTGVPGA